MVLIVLRGVGSKNYSGARPFIILRRGVVSQSQLGLQNHAPSPPDPHGHPDEASTDQRGPCATPLASAHVQLTDHVGVQVIPAFTPNGHMAKAQNPLILALVVKLCEGLPMKPGTAPNWPLKGFGDHLSGLERTRHSPSTQARLGTGMLPCSLVHA